MDKAGRYRVITNITRGWFQISREGSFNFYLANIKLGLRAKNVANKWTILGFSKFEAGENMDFNETIPRQLVTRSLTYVQILKHQTEC